MNPERLFWELAAELQAEDSRVAEGTIMNGRCHPGRRDPDSAPGAAREPDPPGRFPWPERWVRLLGRVPDAEVAHRAGLHIGTVRDERTRREIEPACPRRPPVEWTPEMDALLGQAIDREVAAELGISFGSVYYRRRVLGIPPAKPRAPRKSGFWTRRRLSQLGKTPDNRLARRWGISAGTVAHRRWTLGIPPFKPRPQRIEWTEEMRCQLGVIPDAELARRLGIGERAVREERRRLGIAPVGGHGKKVVRAPELRPQLVGPTREVARRLGVGIKTVFELRRELGVPAPPRPTSWTEEALAKLGQVPDEELAAELGLQVDTVRMKRLGAGLRKRTVRRWTPAEEELIRELEPAAAAEKTGRTLQAVLKRRRDLGLKRAKGGPGRGKP